MYEELPTEGKSSWLRFCCLKHLCILHFLPNWAFRKYLFFVLLVEQAAQQWPVSSGADFNFASENKPKAGGFSAR